MSFVADRAAFTASTLQIGSYHSYQHRKLQAAEVTITEPDSAVSAFEASSATLSESLKITYHKSEISFGC